LAQKTVSSPSAGIRRLKPGPDTKMPHTGRRFAVCMTGIVLFRCGALQSVERLENADTDATV
jgi:hypothetical protein